MSQSSFTRRRKDKADPIRGKTVAAEMAFAIKTNECLDSASTFASGWHGRVHFPAPVFLLPIFCIPRHIQDRGMPTLTSPGVPSQANSSFPD